MAEFSLPDAKEQEFSLPDAEVKEFSLPDGKEDNLIDKAFKGIVAGGEFITATVGGLAGQAVGGLSTLTGLATGDTLAEAVGGGQAVAEKISAPFQPRTLAGQEVTAQVGEAFETGFEAVGEAGAQIAPEGFEEEGRLIARVGVESLLVVAPFIPKVARGVKARTPQALRDVENAAIRANEQALLEKAFKGPGAQDLQVQIGRIQRGLDPIPEHAATKLNSSISEGMAPNTALVGGVAVTLPKTSRLGNLIDSPHLRLEQKFPDSILPLRLRRMEQQINEKKVQFDAIVNELEVAETLLRKKGLDGDIKTAWLLQDKVQVKELTGKVLGAERNTQLWREYDVAMDLRLKEMRSAGLTTEITGPAGKKVKVPLVAVQDYLPRFITDFKALRKIIPSKKQNDLRKLQRKLKKGEITEAEFSLQLNNMITSGGSPFIVRPVPGAAKKRVSVKARRDLHPIYANPTGNLRNYFNETAASIVERNFLGAGKNVDEAIGTLVAKEITEKRILPTQAEELTAALSPRFGAAAHSGPNRFIGMAKDVGYIGTIGQVGSAITQLGDVMGAIRQGPLQAAKGAAVSLLPKPIRTKLGGVETTDVAIGEIMQELVGQPTKIKGLLDTTLRVSGFKLVDRFGKRTVLTAAKFRFKNLAKTEKGRKKLEAMGYKQLFDKIGEWDNFIADLKTGNLKNPNVRFAVVNELADVQPIFLSDMPIAYLQNPNGRVAYTLKTWSIRQINRVRSDVMKGNVKEAAAYALAMYLGTNSVTLMKEVAFSAWHGIALEPTDLSNMATNNALKFMLGSKFLLNKAMSGETGEVVADMILPPALGIIDALIKDIRDWDDEEKRSRLLSVLPVVGRTVQAAQEEEVERRERARERREQEDE